MKATIIKKGMTNIRLEDCLMNSSLIAGSSKYAIDEVLPASSNEKKTDKSI